MESIRRNMRPDRVRRIGLRAGEGGEALPEPPSELRSGVGLLIVLMTPSKERDAEGRGQPGRNPGEGSRVRTQNRVALPSNLARVNAAARTAVRTRFTALLHHVNEEALERAFRRQRRQASAGIDGMTVAMYAQDLEGNLRDLCARIHTGRYRPHPVRRVSIPKPMADSARSARRHWRTRSSKARSQRC